MKRGLSIGLTGIALGAMGLPAFAQLQTFPGLFNTGVDNTGVPQADNVPDLHYTFATPPPTGTVPVVATAANGFPIPPWLGDNFSSAWITPAPDTTGNLGNYTYRTTFTVPAGVDPNKAFLTGRWTSDNAGVDILINGQSTGITNTGNFAAFDPQWVIKSGLKTGANTIDFVVNEASGAAGAGGYTGLRVEMTGRYAPANHVTIPMRNSGVATPGGTPLPEDSVDPNVVLVPPGLVTGPAFVTTAAGGFPVGPWLGDNGTSAWLAPAPDTNGPEGQVHYQTTFNLTGVNPASVVILGRWAVDNDGVDILLNGVPTGNGNFTSFTDWSEFTLSAATGETFLPGLNTLTFVTNNGPGAGPTGIRYEFLSATGAPVPEPATAALALIGMAGALIRRRRR